MVRMTTLPAARARCVHTNGPVAIAATAAAPVNQFRRVNRAPDPPPGPWAGLPPCSSLRSVIMSSLRVVMLPPAPGRAGVGCLPRAQLGCIRGLARSLIGAERPLRLVHGLAEGPVVACRFARCQADLPTVLGLVKIDPRFLVSTMPNHEASMRPTAVGGAPRVFRPVYGPGAPGRSARSCTGSPSLGGLQRPH